MALYLEYKKHATVHVCDVQRRVGGRKLPFCTHKSAPLVSLVMSWRGAARSPLQQSSALSNGADMSAVQSGDSSKSRAEEATESFRRLSLEALQHNARQWLSCLVASPLPDDVPFERLVSNGALLARVTGSLVAASRVGTSQVTPVVVSEDELGLGDSPRGAARQKAAAQENATQLITNCRSLGLRSAELCTTSDVLNVGAAAQSARAVCVTLYAVSIRAKALGLRLPPFPVNDVQLPRDATRQRAAQFNAASAPPSGPVTTPRSGWSQPPLSAAAGSLAAPVTPDVTAAPRSVVGDNGTPRTGFGSVQHGGGHHGADDAMSAAETEVADDAVSVSGDVLLHPTSSLTPAVTPMRTPVRGGGSSEAAGPNGRGASSLPFPKWSPGSASSTLYVAAAAAAGAALVAYVALSAGTQRGRTTRWRPRGGDVRVLWRSLPQR